MKNITFCLNIRENKNRILSNIFIIIIVSLPFLYAIYSSENINIEFKKILLIIFGVAVLVALYERFHLIFSLDSILVTDIGFILKKSDFMFEYKYSEIKFIVKSGIDGKKIISFYNSKTSRLLFTLDEKDIEEGKITDFIDAISKYTILDSEMLSNTTYGEVLELTKDNNVSVCNNNYVFKKTFYNSYWFFVIIFIIILSLLVFILIKI